MEHFDVATSFTLKINWSDLVGDLAIIATVVNFASGIKICYRIFKQSNTADCTPVPFMMGMLCTFLWFQYGIRKPDMIVTCVNVIGFIMQTAFLFWFYFYTKPKGSLNLKIGGLLVSIVSLHVWLHYYGASDTEAAMRIAGSLGIVASIGFFASPLALLARVLQTRCSQYLPLPLILSSLTVAILWTTYGTLQSDLFIVVSNALATLITASQLALVCVFPRKPAGDAQRLI